MKIIQKLTSRKLLMAIAGVVIGLSVSLGVDASDIETLIGTVTSLVSAVSYIIAESKVDAARIGNAAQCTQENADAL